MMYITQATENKINAMVKADNSFYSCGYALKQIINVIKAQHSYLGVTIKEANKNGVFFENDFEIIIEEHYPYNGWAIDYPEIFDYKSKYNYLFCCDFNKLVRLVYNRFLTERV